MSTTPQPSTLPSVDPIRALLHEWFVVYNPIYLASAALVLAGVWLIDQELAVRGGALGHLGMPAVAEVYALALIGSAAILERIGQRRVAAMLGLLAALYQCDLTMHCETAPFVGAWGPVASAVWVAMFTLKLHLLGKALALRLSRSALFVPVSGAVMLAAVPHVLPQLGRFAGGTIVALAVFAVILLALSTTRAIGRAFGFDYRGRRSVRGVWLLLSAAGLAHLLYWVPAFGVPLSSIVLPLAFGVLLFAREERTVWMFASGLVVLLGLGAPELLALTAFFAATVLCLRALRARQPAKAKEASIEPPYRGDAVAPAVPAITELGERPISFGPSPLAERSRLLSGAAVFLHLALSASGQRTLLFEHDPWLDGIALVLVAVAAAHLRRPALLGLVAPSGLHAAIAAGLLRLPESGFAWGLSAIALGFGLLGACVAVSWWLGRLPVTSVPSEGPDGARPDFAPHDLAPHDLAPR